MATSTSTFAKPKLRIWFAVCAHGCKLPELAVYTCPGPTDTRDHNSMTTPHLHSFVACESPRIPSFLYYSHNLIRHLFEVRSPRTLISASRTYRDMMSCPSTSTLPFLLRCYSRRLLTAILFHCISTGTYTLPRLHVWANHDNVVFFITAFIRPYYFCLLEEYMLSALMILTTKAYVAL